METFETSLGPEGDIAASSTDVLFSCAVSGRTVLSANLLGMAGVCGERDLPGDEDVRVENGRVRFVEDVLDSSVRVKAYCTRDSCIAQ